MVQNLGNNTITPAPVENNPTDKYIFKSDFSIDPPLPACAHFNPPCPMTRPQPINFKAGQAIDGVLEGSSLRVTGFGVLIPLSVLSIPNAASRGGEPAATQSRDAWTGKVEWGKAFTFRNVFLVIFFMFLIYLFLKHMLPLIKKSIAK